MFRVPWDLASGNLVDLDLEAGSPVGNLPETCLAEVCRVGTCLVETCLVETAAARAAACL